MHRLTRRRWLTRSLGSMAAAGCLTYRLHAADDLEPIRFTIVSDTHLGRNDSESPLRQWRQAIDEINAAPGEFVLHLGDIVDGGRAAWYPRYVESRRRLQKPIHEVPGNHDPDDLFREHVRPAIDTRFDHRGVRFVLFGNARVDSHDGFIRDDQIDWLDRQCAEAVEKNLRVVVACHVPIHTNRNPDRAWYVKPDQGQNAFYRLVERYGDRLLVCFHGHFHNGIRGWRDRGRLVEVLCPSVCYNQNRGLREAIETKKTDGFFVDELRPGYVQATLGRGVLTMQYKPLGAESPGNYQARWSG